MLAIPAFQASSNKALTGLCSNHHLKWWLLTAVMVVRHAGDIVEFAVGQMPENIIPNVSEYVQDSIDNAVPGKEVNISEQINVSDALSMDIDFGAGIITIKEKESDDGIIDVSISGRGEAKVGTEGGKLEIDAFTDAKTGNSNNRTDILIPKGYSFADVNLDLAACEAEIAGLQADNMCIEIGAGNSKMSGLTTQSFDMRSGAAKTFITDADITKANIELGMGDITFDGKISGDMKLDVGLGNAALDISGSETDHNYEVECGLGSVEIGSMKFKGVADKKQINNNASSEFDVKCGMGNVKIYFK